MVPGPAELSGRKYSTTTASAQKFLSPNAVPVQELELLSAAFAASTWKKHEAAINSFTLFSRCTNCHSTWPLSHNNIASYVTWAYNVKKLKSTMYIQLSLT